ncbi:hypothetical protein ACFFLJ_01650 [Acetobacter farinalis]|uniref:hypothetical protein n=1 Tax=Acetobacter farinalis TaxID=1260984 RepID=UPI00140A90A4|nr:hypothetical protein [Acetobacter farinalis]
MAIAGNAYGNTGFHGKITLMKVKAVIPSQGTRKPLMPHDRIFYKSRNCIEEYLNHFKHFHRFVPRDTCRTIHSTGFIHLAAAMT